jgi:hypothetical protein
VIWLKISEKYSTPPQNGGEFSTIWGGVKFEQSGPNFGERQIQKTMPPDVKQILLLIFRCKTTLFQQPPLAGQRRIKGRFFEDYYMKFPLGP